MQLIDETAASQDTLQSSLVERASKIPAVSGVLVTLIAAIAAIGNGDNVGHNSPGGITWLAIASLVSLVSSALCAIVVQAPRKYQRVATSALRELAEDNEYWEDADEATALQRTAEVKVDYIESAVQSNQRAAKWLIGAYTIQVLGIALLAMAVVVWVLA